MQIRVKKLSKTAVVPRYAHSTDAGLDLVVDDVKYTTNGQVEYNSNLALEIPEGYVGLLFPRSSVKNYGLRLTNCVGVIDSGYRGPVKAVFQETGVMTKLYAVGDRFAQLIIMPYPQVELIEAEDLSESDRGEGGYGSTGM